MLFKKMLPKDYRTIFYKLSQAEHNNNQPLFNYNHEDRSWLDLKLLANKIYLKLLKQNSSPEYALLLVDDSFLLAASLIACWSLQLTPITPNSLEIEQSQKLLKEDLIVLYDQTLNISSHHYQIPFIAIPTNENEQSSIDPSFEQIVHSYALNIELECALKIIQLTSGSTGNPKKIEHTLGSLYEENFEITHTILKPEQKTHDLMLLATVHNFHAFGFQFRLLFSLLNNIYSYSAMVSYQEQFDLFAIYKKETIVVTSPGFLKRLDQQHCKLKIANVISAGGKLTERAFYGLNNYFNHAVIDILGSTETGAVAYRSTTNMNKPLQAFKNNKVYCLDVQNNLAEHGMGQLAIKASYIPLAFKQKLFDQSHNSQQVFVSEDLIELDPSGFFRILGRLSRVIKIEDNRIALDDLEKALMQLDLIKECAVIPFSSHQRETTAALLVLSTEGQKYLSQNSLGKLLIYIRNNVVGINPIAIPRKIAIADQLPLTPNGKINYPKIEELF